jgi:hypothetical protein
MIATYLKSKEKSLKGTAIGEVSSEVLRLI